MSEEVYFKEKLDLSWLSKFAEKWASKLDGVEQITLYDSERSDYLLIFRLTGDPPEHRLTYKAAMIAWLNEITTLPEDEKKITSTDKLREWFDENQHQYIDNPRMEVMRSIIFKAFIDSETIHKAYKKGIPLRDYSKYRYDEKDPVTPEYIDQWEACPIYAKENIPTYAGPHSWQLYPSIEEQKEVIPSALSEKEAEAAQNDAVNFFIKENGDLWYIRFQGKEARIKDLAGLQHIARLLEVQPGTSISCRELYQVATRTVPDNAISEGAAIDQGLNIGSSKQEVSDHKAKEEYLKEYHKLQNDLENAESNMERQEIEKEMDHIMNGLKGKHFADPDEKKAQVNVKKRLDTAYASIRDAKMNELEKHLRDSIKTDGAFGLKYTGSVNWE